MTEENGIGVVHATFPFLLGYPLPISNFIGFADKYSNTFAPCSANAAAITFRGF